MRKAFLSITVILALGLGAFLALAPAIADDRFNPVRPHDPYVIRPEAQTLHDSLIVGDWHADSLLWDRDLLVRNEQGHIDLPRLLEGNVTLQVFTAVTQSPQGQNYINNSAEAPDRLRLLVMGQAWPPRTWDSMLERALYQSEKLHDFAATSEALSVIRSEADLDAVLAARSAGQDAVGAILGIEGAHALEGDLANLEALTDAGYRLIGLHHFIDNSFGGSLHGTSQGGLTEDGRALVAEIAARGLILDLAHSSPRVVQDVLEMVEMPVVLSHTGIYSHCPRHRNIADRLMRDIAATGGVIGIGYWETASCDDSPDGVASAILAAVDLVGVDHVSLGSDYDGTVTVSFDTSELAVITQALMDAGLTDADIAKVMGDNMLRVLRARLD